MNIRRLLASLLLGCSISCFGAPGNILLTPTLPATNPLAGITFLAKFQSRIPGSTAPICAYTNLTGGVRALNDGDAISALLDQSGNVLNVTQTNSTNQPKLRFVNGFPVWRFDGSSSGMNLGSITTTNPCTVMFGINSSHTQAARMISFASPFARSQVNAINGAVAIQGSGTYSTTTYGHPDDFHVLEAIFNGATSKIYADGFLEFTGNPGTTTIASNSFIGWDGVSADMLKGDIFAIFVIQGQLSATDRTRVVNYMESINPLPGQRKWNRLGGITTPTLSWESTAVQEPRPIYRGVNNWAMAYTGGFSPEAIGWQTSTDGQNWTKNPNPIIGAGFGGETNARGPCLVEPTPGTLEMYYGTGFPSALYRQISTDNGATWGSKTTVLPIASMPSGATGYSNMFMAFDSGANTWRILCEFSMATTSFALYSATSTDRVTWSGLAPVSGIAIAGAETNAGWWTKEGSVYHLFYHAVSGNGGALPTDIYHATSTDFATWTRFLGPVMPRYLEPIGSALAAMGPHDNFDQTADLRMINLGGTYYAFYALTNNTNQTGVLVLATYTGTLSSLQAQ